VEAATPLKPIGGGRRKLCRPKHVPVVRPENAAILANDQKPVAHQRNPAQVIGHAGQRRGPAVIQALNINRAGVADLHGNVTGHEHIHDVIPMRQGV